LQFVRIEEHLRRLLGRKVDLVRKEGLRPELKDHILREVVYL
jgi:predicted nucleotidyltransferase